MKSSFDVANTKPSYHDLKKMKQIHHEIALMATLGCNNKEIARKLDVTPQMVTVTLNSTLVKRKLKLLRGARDEEALNVQKRIEELAPLALDEIEQILLNPNTPSKERAKEANNILDRAGFSPVHRFKDESKETLTTKDINEIKEIAKKNGMLVHSADEVEEAQVVDETNGTDDEISEEPEQTTSG